MAAFGPTVLKYTSKSVNSENVVLTEHELAQALANTDTLDLDKPAGVDLALVPVSIQCWSNAVPRVLQTAYGMTNYNPSTGRLRLTATGAVADNSTFVILWMPAVVGT